MAQNHHDQSSVEGPARATEFYDWEVSVARARERASALRSSIPDDTVADVDANQAAYDELALSFEELTVAQEELRTLNDEVGEASARIEQERRRYHELFLAAPVPFIVTDKHGVIREVNQAASQLIRLPPERLAGKPVVVFVHDVSRRRLRRAMLDRNAAPGTSSVRFSLSPRGAPPAFVEATLSSVADASGAVHEIRWLVVDRTRAALEARDRRARRHELLELVAARTAELEQEQLIKDRLVATVSHEFRTGLAAIGGYAELLEMGIHGPLTEVQMSDIRRIRSAYEHLGLVVEDLLNYSKIVAGKLAVELTDVELGEAIRSLAELITPQSSEKDIVVQLEEPGQEVLVRADAERVRQILLNVAGNAVKFSPPGSSITIRWQRSGPVAIVETIDSGPGVPEESREAVFEPFSRLENSRSVPGTGLGLAISRELARAMGGELSMEPSPAGTGSSFLLHLPCSMPLAPGETTEP